MDLFHRAKEPASRELTWIKPFDNRMDEITRLKEKSETCPKQMKKVFLSAWGELASQVKMHQKTAAAIVKSELPLKVYYDVVLQTEIGNSNIDFLVIADEVILVIMHRKREHIEWDLYDTRFARLPSRTDEHSVEDASCLLANFLHDEKVLGVKDLNRIVSVLVDDEAEEEDLPKPFERSDLYPDLPAPVKVHPDAMGRWILANCEVSDPPFFNEKKWEKIRQILEMNMTPV